MLPLVLTIGAFVVRLIMVLMGAKAQSVDYAQDSRFADVSALVFLEGRV